MNLILGILVGAAVGWATFRLLRMNTGQGIGVSLAIGVFGGGMGVQFAPMVSAAPVGDGQLNIFALVIAAAVASALLVITSMISSRRGG
jgi:uncharacterized membrane protein YeaQ/YmgE (transglycosylase-associated protein family)